MTKEKIEFEKRYDYLYKDGKYYEWKSADGKPFLVLVDTKKVEEKIEKASKIAHAIKDGLDAFAVIRESLMHLSDKDLEKLLKLVSSEKRHYKPKTRSGYCVDMKVGKFIIPIAE